jgi:hypothetical protein
MPITTSGTSITFNDATVQTTAFTGGGGGVTSLNGQTGAITDTDLGAIGSTGQFIYAGTSNLVGGATVSGADLRYANTIASGNTGRFYSQFTNDSNNSGFASAQGGTLDSLYVRRYTGNSGYQVPLNTTALSGTWRVSLGIAARNTFYDGENNRTDANNGLVVCARVS